MLPPTPHTGAPGGGGRGATWVCCQMSAFLYWGRCRPCRQHPKGDGTHARAACGPTNGAQQQAHLARPPAPSPPPPSWGSASERTYRWCTKAAAAACGRSSVSRLAGGGGAPAAVALAHDCCGPEQDCLQQEQGMCLSIETGSYSCPARPRLGVWGWGAKCPAAVQREALLLAATAATTV